MCLFNDDVTRVRIVWFVEFCEFLPSTPRQLSRCQRVLSKNAESQTQTCKYNHTYLQMVSPSEYAYTKGITLGVGPDSKGWIEVTEFEFSMSHTRGSGST